MNLKIIKGGSPTYLFNITQILFGKINVPTGTSRWEDDSILVDCVWLYNEANPKGLPLTGDAVIKEVRQKLEERDSEFLVIESESV